MVDRRKVIIWLLKAIEMDCLDVMLLAAGQITITSYTSHPHTPLTYVGV